MGKCKKQLDSEQKLRVLLSNVADSYEDFVNVILLLSKRNNLVDQMIEFVESTPDVTTSDVDIKINDLRGLKPVYTEGK